MRGEGEDPEGVEDQPVEEAVDHALGRHQHDEHHHKLGVKDQEPGDDAAHDAAAVADEPHGVGAVAQRGGGRSARASGSQLASRCPWCGAPGSSFYKTCGSHHHMLRGETADRWRGSRGAERCGEHKKKERRELDSR